MWSSRLAWPNTRIWIFPSLRSIWQGLFVLLVCLLTNYYYRETRVTAARLLRSGNQEKVRTLVLHQAADPRWDAENTAVFFPYEIPKARGKDDKFQGASVLNAHRGVYGDIKRGYAVYKEWRENKVVAMTAAAVAAAAQAQAQTNPDAAAQRVLVLDYKSLYPSVMIR